MAQMVLQMCQKLRQASGLTDVVLSGGVWQNVILLQNTLRLLQTDGFNVYWHQRIPANDGGLALGQAVIAACKLKENGD
jgi:hydrogenase maturation protein HypF